MGSERFEKSIAEWYEKRNNPPEYLNLEIRQPEPVKSQIGQTYCFGSGSKHHIFHTEDKQLNYLSDICTVIAKNQEYFYDRLSLFTRISLKYYHSLSENLTETNNQLLNSNHTLSLLQSKVSRFEEIQNSYKPLTKGQVLSLVQEIAAQLKLIEQEALNLTANLEQKVAEIQLQVNELKELLASVKALIS